MGVLDRDLASYRASTYTTGENQYLSSVPRQSYYAGGATGQSYTYAGGATGQSYTYAGGATGQSYTYAGGATGTQMSFVSGPPSGGQGKVVVNSGA